MKPSQAKLGGGGGRGKVERDRTISLVLQATAYSLRLCVCVCVYTKLPGHRQKGQKFDVWVQAARRAACLRHRLKLPPPPPIFPLQHFGPFRPRHGKLIKLSVRGSGKNEN